MIRTNGRLCRVVFCFSCIALGAYVVHHVNITSASYTILQSVSSNVPAHHHPAVNRSGFLVYTPVCKIPDLSPFDPSILSFFKRTKKFRCSGKPPGVYVDGTFLRFNRTYMEGEWGRRFSHCLYEVILRSDENHNDFAYSEAQEKIYNDTKMADEFIRLICYDKSGKVLSTSFHGFILPKEDVEKRCERNVKKHIQRHNPREVLSVQIVGIDSVSRLNFMRHMPRTREFLLDDLGAVEMLGYNKVGDNTFPNVVPMLSGRTVKELPWSNKVDRLKPFDDYAFIWKNFSQAGYRTLFVEDAPSMATFDYQKEGFHRAPTDYFSRGLVLALENEKRSWNGKVCVNHVTETEFMLDYLLRFLRQFGTKPKFGFTFLTRLTHDKLNLAGAADDPYLTFLRTLKVEGHLNSTVLVFMSDHGIRFGGIRNVYVGKMEERLPFCFLVFPEWFGRKYRKLLQNLRLNSRRLTTPFDIYETLKDILYFDGKVRAANLSQRGISLFREIPEMRSCAHAHIDIHWCTCAKRIAVSTSDTIVRQIASDVVRKINLLLEPERKLCATLKLKTIHGAELFVEGEDEVRFEQHQTYKVKDHGQSADTSTATYQVSVETEPGNAMFEATLRYKKSDGSTVLQGGISRTNMYGNQSECIDSFYLRTMCYCRHLLT